MKNQCDFILDLMKLFYILYFSLKIYFNCGSNSLAFFLKSRLVNCEQPSKRSDIFSVTTIITRSTDIKKPQLDRMV